MNITTKNIIIWILIALTFTGMYFGVYLPWRKARLLIRTFSILNGGSTLEQFQSSFGYMLDFYSPVGQDEAISNYLNGVIRVMNDQDEPEIIAALAKDAEERMRPVLQKGSGFSFSQNIFNLATVYRLAAVKLQSEEYYNKSLAMFERGLDASPNRKMFLYGLLDLYLIGSQNDKARELGEYILTIWPDDEKIKEVLNNLPKFLKSNATTS